MKGKTLEELLKRGEEQQKESKELLEQFKKCSIWRFKKYWSIRKELDESIARTDEILKELSNHN